MRLLESGSPGRGKCPQPGALPCTQMTVAQQQGFGMTSPQGLHWESLVTWGEDCKGLHDPPGPPRLSSPQALQTETHLASLWPGLLPWGPLAASLGRLGVRPAHTELCAHPTASSPAGLRAIGSHGEGALPRNEPPTHTRDGQGGLGRS